MSSYKRTKILEALRQLEVPTLDGEVLEVDLEAFTCRVKTAAGIELPDVQLKALKNAPKGVVLIPVIGSTVQVLELTGGEYLIVAVEEVDTIYMDAATKIVINGGEHEGLVVVGKLVERLNTFEQDINTVKQVFTAWSPVPGDGGAALKAAAATWAGQQLQPTQQSDIENPKVTH